MKLLDKMILVLIVVVFLFYSSIALQIVFEIEQSKQNAFDSNSIKKFLGLDYYDDIIIEIEDYENTTWYKENPLTQTELKTLISEEIRYIIHNKGKRPPKKYRDWIQFVNKKKCPKSLDYYQQIFEDLSPFYEVEYGKTVSKITKQKFEKILNNENFLSLSVRKHKCLPSKEWRYKLEPFIEKLSEFIPENFDLPFNAYDEDIIILPDDGDTEKPYKNVKEIFERNECFRTTYNNNQTEIHPGSIAYYHGVFIEPGWIKPIPELLPLWSWGKRDCFKDICFLSLQLCQVLMIE